MKYKTKYTVCVGDKVLIKDNIPRGRWRLGTISELINSADGVTRSAKVQTASEKSFR
jgi:hypothetical protein